MDKKTGIFLSGFILGIVILLGAFYKSFVVDLWGDIFHIPWNVWIAWIFWVVLGILIFLVIFGILFLYSAFKSAEELIEKPKERKKNKTKTKKKTKKKAKKKQPQKSGEPQIKTVNVAEKKPEHPAEWDEEEFD